MNASSNNSATAFFAAILLGFCLSASAQPANQLGLSAPNPSQWSIVPQKIGELGAAPPMPDQSPPGKILGGKDGKIRFWRYERGGNILIERWFFDKVFIERVEGGVSIKDLRRLSDMDILPPAAFMDFDYTDWAGPAHKVGQVTEGKKLFDYYAAPTDITTTTENLPSDPRAIREATRGLRGVRELWVDSLTQLPVQVIWGGYLYRFEFAPGSPRLSAPDDLLKISQEYEESLRSPVVTR